MGKERDDVICIVGMHRSGTSMVARLLNLCGLYLGPEELLLGPDQGNPQGHFEHMGFLEIDEALLRHFGGGLYNLPPVQDGWENDPSIEALRRKAQALIGTFANHAPWGWKEPRTTLLLPFWKNLIPHIRFVVCVRSPLEVANSLKKREAMPIQEGAFLWNLYMQSALRNTEGSPRMMTFYEDFFHEPMFEMERVLQFCGLETPADSKGVLQLVSGDLRRNVSSITSLLEEKTIPLGYKLFYLALRAVGLRERRNLARGANKTDSSLGESWGAVLDAAGRFNDESALARCQAELTSLNATFQERERLLIQVKAENTILRDTLDAMERSLTWQVMKIMERLRGSILPAGTSRGEWYDRCLLSLKRFFGKV
jgi:sulfotransferase family protein